MHIVEDRDVLQFLLHKEHVDALERIIEQHQQELNSASSQCVFAGYEQLKNLAPQVEFAVKDVLKTKVRCKLFSPDQTYNEANPRRLNPIYRGFLTFGGCLAGAGGLYATGVLSGVGIAVLTEFGLMTALVTAGCTSANQAQDEIEHETALGRFTNRSINGIQIYGSDKIFVRPTNRGDGIVAIAHECVHVAQARKNMPEYGELCSRIVVEGHAEGAAFHSSHQYGVNTGDWAGYLAAVERRIHTLTHGRNWVMGNLHRSTPTYNPDDFDAYGLGASFFAIQEEVQGQDIYYQALNGKLAQALLHQTTTR